MSHIFDPSRNTKVNDNHKNHGYVTRLLELPLACARFEGLVVFCGEDKRFYECQHIETPTEDYYEWVAVTTGAQRIYFIPVEALTETEMANEATMASNIRTCCFDAIASAIDEILYSCSSAVSLHEFTHLQPSAAILWNSHLPLRSKCLMWFLLDDRWRPGSSQSFAAV